MAKHQHTPRPTAPPSPMQQKQALLAVEPSKYDATAPVLTSVGLGRTEDGRHVAAILKTQGRTILSCRPLETPTRTLEVAEEAWRASAYLVLYHGETLPTVEGPPLHEGKALALHRLPTQRTAVVLLEVEDGKLLPPDPDKPALFDGSRGEAWLALDDWASHNLLLSTLAERRRRAAGA